MMVGAAVSLLSCQCKTCKRRQRKREKKTDSPVQNKKRVAESAVGFSGVSVSRGRIGNSPVRSHGLSWPERAGFPGGVVANSEDEVHRRSAGPRELVPALAAQAGCGYASHRKLLQRFGTNRPRRLASWRVGGEGGLYFVFEDRLRHDRPRRVSRAQEQNVVASIH